MSYNLLELEFVQRLCDRTASPRQQAEALVRASELPDPERMAGLLETLIFLGEVSARQLEAISAAFNQAAADTSAPDPELEALERRVGELEARVAALGAQDAEAVALQSRLQETLEATQQLEARLQRARQGLSEVTAEAERMQVLSMRARSGPPR